MAGRYPLSARGGSASGGNYKGKGKGTGGQVTVVRQSPPKGGYGRDLHLAKTTRATGESSVRFRRKPQKQNYNKNV